MKTNFYLRDVQKDLPQNKQKETAIILFATHPNGRFKYYSGQHVKPYGWDFDKQICKKNVRTNTVIANVKDKFEEVYADLIKRGIRITNDSLQKELLIKLQQDEAGNSEPIDAPITTLYKLLVRFEEARKALRTRGTMLRYKALKMHLLSFEKAQGKEVNLSDLNLEFGDAFSSHLFNNGQTRSGEKKSNMRNTVGKLMIGLKVVLNWAVSSGYTLPPHYKKFPIPSAPTKIIALNETEFHQFLTKELPKEEHITRDLFCFSAYTGLRFSDVVRITPEMVNGDFLNITTKKTEHTLKVYLLPEAKEILSKYKNTFKGLRTNQGSNKGVKRIARLAGINERIKITEYFGNRTVDKTVEKWEVLSFHSAKKTNVTLSLKNGVRPEVLSAQIGNTMRTLKPYIAIADTDKVEEISRAFKSIKKVASKLRVA